MMSWKLAAAGVATVALAAVAFAAPQQQLLLGVGSAATSASFQGAGDVVAFTSYWGASFAYKASTRGASNFVVNLCYSGVCADVGTDSTTGVTTNAPTVNGAACNNSTHICIVHEVYDQVSTHHMVAPSGLEPTWVVDGYATGIPCVKYTRASGNIHLASNPAATITGAFLISAVFKRDTGQGTNVNIVWGDDTANVLAPFAQDASGVTIYDNSGANTVRVALTDGTWGASGAVMNGAGGSAGNGYLNVNGTTSSNASLGSTDPNTVQCIGTSGTGCGTSTDTYSGMICEVGVISATSSTATADSLVTNARASYRYNF